MTESASGPYACGSRLSTLDVAGVGGGGEPVGNPTKGPGTRLVVVASAFVTNAAGRNLPAQPVIDTHASHDGADAALAQLAAAPGAVDWGSVPDWIAGIGSVAAFAAFAVAFLWEVRKRRDDDRRGEDERRDALKRHARLVHVRPIGGSTTQVRLTIANAGPGPIVDLQTTVWRESPDLGRLVEIPAGRRNPDASIIDAGEAADVWLWLDEGEVLERGEAFFLRVEFTDCDGNRWQRTDNGQPVPVT